MGLREELGRSLLKEVSVSLHVVREELSVSLLKGTGVSLLKGTGVSLHVVREELCVSPLVVGELSSAVHMVLEWM